MSVPAIRYPLPTFVALIVLVVAAWWGSDRIGQIRAELGKRVEAIVTDQVPTEPDPKWTKAPIPRRGLLLHDDLRILDKPDGSNVLTILGKRRIVDLLNAWPPRGAPTHYRFGQADTPLGWVKADALLPWDTRLIVRPPQQGLVVEGGTIPSGSPPLPITAIDGQAGTVLMAEWDPDDAWKVVRRVRTAKISEIPPESLEVLASRSELLELLKSPDTPSLRGRAALGRLVVGASIPVSPEAQAMLEPAFRQAAPYDASAPTALTDLNRNWRPDASWDVHSFRGIPLSLIP